MVHRIVVLGAGYAGLPAAGRLARWVRTDQVEVTLVNESATFVERPRMHQLAAGQRLREVRLADVLRGTGAQLRLGRVSAIDPAAHRIVFGDGSTMDYDTLVYGLGSTTDRNAVPGAADNAFGFGDTAESLRLSQRLAASPTSRVIVCGGGLTGIETAAEFAEAFPGMQVELVSAGAVGGWLSPKARRYLLRTFATLGVVVRENTRVSEVGVEKLTLADGSLLPFDVCLWAGGFTVPTLARDSGLAVDRRGRIRTDETLRSVSHPDIYAIGDAAAVPGAWGDALAMGCRLGGFTGPQVADIIAARLAGREPRRFRFRYFHECISLGRGHGLVQFLRRDETPKDAVLTGRLGIRYKEIVLSSALVLFRWPGPYRPHRRVAPAVK
jgi:NADH dehydrogenase FAD-containing subunit